MLTELNRNAAIGCGPNSSHMFWFDIAVCFPSTPHVLRSFTGTSTSLLIYVSVLITE
jgi:hypothetical protein